MKFYEILVYKKYTQILFTKNFPKGKEFKDLKEYFKKHSRADVIRAKDKLGRHIYTEYRNGDYIKRLYNDENVKIYIEFGNGKIAYPAGKKAYDEYINKKRKEKLEKILNK